MKFHYFMHVRLNFVFNDNFSNKVFLVFFLCCSSVVCLSLYSSKLKKHFDDLCWNRCRRAANSIRSKESMRARDECGYKRKKTYIYFPVNIRPCAVYEYVFATSGETLKNGLSSS